CSFFVSFCQMLCYFFFFLTQTSPPEIYTLSLHDALPISKHCTHQVGPITRPVPAQRNRQVLSPGLPALPWKLSPDATGGWRTAWFAAIDASWNQTTAAQAIPQLPGPQTPQYRPPKPLDWPVTEVISDRGGIT